MFGAADDFTLFATIFICVANLDLIEIIYLEIRKCFVYNAKNGLIYLFLSCF